MKVNTCPHEFSGTELQIFLAGGISGCPDWQQEMIQRLKHINGHTILHNPRRRQFDVTDVEEHIAQIRWESTYLRSSHAIMFWFPYHTLCPMTLFELGHWSATDKDLIVGCHPGYLRAVDVREQLARVRPDVVVHDNWEPMITDVERLVDRSIISPNW